MTTNETWRRLYLNKISYKYSYITINGNIWKIEKLQINVIIKLEALMYLFLS